MNGSFHSTVPVKLSVAINSRFNLLNDKIFIAGHRTRRGFITVTYKCKILSSLVQQHQVLNESSSAARERDIQNTALA